MESVHRSRTHRALTDALTSAEKIPLKSKRQGKIFPWAPTFVPNRCLPLQGQARPAVMDLLDDSDYNAIRCWGGSVYTRDDYLYTRCDELGILIWQDFMVACLPSDRRRFAVLSVTRRKPLSAGCGFHATLCFGPVITKVRSVYSVRRLSQGTGARGRITRQVLQGFNRCRRPHPPLPSSSPYVGP